MSLFLTHRASLSFLSSNRKSGICVRGQGSLEKWKEPESIYYDGEVEKIKRLGSRKTSIVIQPKSKDGANPSIKDEEHAMTYPT
jgi:hypothetical protein